MDEKINESPFKKLQVPVVRVLKGFFNLKNKIMKITFNKIIRELRKTHGWTLNEDSDEWWFIEHLIKDTISVIDTELIKHKNITIKK